MGDAEQARHYYERTLKEQLDDGARREAAVTLYNIGRSDERLARWDAAAASFARALAMAQDLDYPRGRAYALRGLASVANARGDGARALQLVADAAVAQRGSPDARLHGQIQLQRGIALTLLRRAGDAVSPLGEALTVFVGAESLTELIDTHRALSEAHAQLGDWQAAYRHAGQLRVHAETLARRQLDQRFAMLKVEFDAAAKDQENALLLRANAAAERLLAEERRARALQAAVIALASLLALTLAWLVVRQRRTGLQLHRLAHTDELTGLPNRRDALARLGAALDERAGCALLIADLDHFKRINDRHGHAAGDEVLRRVGQALAEGLREPASLGRLGGEEFVVVLPGSDLHAALQVGERLRECVRGVDAAGVGDGIALSISVGATASTRDDDVGSMLRRADEALYAAKAAGRDRVHAHAGARPDAPGHAAPQPA
jgi:diguanylate cyclase (GGDEF)-like protein